MVRGVSQAMRPTLLAARAHPDSHGRLAVAAGPVFGGFWRDACIDSGMARTNQGPTDPA